MKSAGIVLRDLAPLMIPQGGGDSRIIVHNCIAAISPKPRNP